MKHGINHRQVRSPRPRTAVRCRQWLTRPNSEPFDHTTPVSKASPDSQSAEPRHPSVSSTTPPTERGDASLIAGMTSVPADAEHLVA